MEINRGIYIIICLENGKIYIGSSDNIARRLTQHQNKLKRWTHKIRDLREDFKKYGESAFEANILEIVSTSDNLKERESYWIEKYNSRNPNIGYNSSSPISNGKRSRDYKKISGGEMSRRAVLTTEDVIDICKRLNRGESLTEIGIRYDVSPAHINQIKAGNNWRDIAEVYLSDEKLSGWKSRPEKRGLSPESISSGLLKQICNELNIAIPIRDISLKHKLSPAAISCIKMGGCRPLETITMLDERILRQWIYNIHLVSSLKDFRHQKNPNVDKAKLNQLMTNTQIAEICIMINSNETNKDIASKYNISPHIISNIRLGKSHKEIGKIHLCSENIKRWGIKVNKKELSEHEVIEICHRINNDERICDIAPDFNRSDAAITHIKTGKAYIEIAKAHLSPEILKTWGKKHHEDKMSENQIIEICGKINCGAKTKDLALEYGVPYSVIGGMKNGWSYKEITKIHLKPEIRKTWGQKTRADKISDSQVIDICGMINNREKSIDIISKHNIDSSILSRIKNGKCYRQISKSHLNPEIIAMWK